MTETSTNTETPAPTEPVESALATGIEKLVENIEISQLEPFLSLLGDHRWIQGGVVFLLFLLLAKVVEWIVTRVVKRLAKHTSTELDDLVVSHLRSPLFWSIVLLGVLFTAFAMGVSQTYHDLLVSLVVSLLIFKWMMFFVRLSRLLLATASRNAKKNALVRTQTLPLFTNLAALIIVVFGIYFIFQAWHVDMTAWIASAGIVGIAVGFAAKDTLANLFSGVFIMADAPYRVGDYIVLDDSTTLRGKVTHIGIRSTRVLTRDDVEVTIPNSIMGNSKVINESGGPHIKYRIRVAVGVAYGSDVDQVRGVLMSVAEESEYVCEDPEPRVRFRVFGASSLDFELLCWIDNPELRGRALDSLNSAVYKRFIEEEIEIPFSKQDLYIKELPTSSHSADNTTSWEN